MANDENVTTPDEAATVATAAPDESPSVWPVATPASAVDSAGNSEAETDDGYRFVSSETIRPPRAV